VEGYKEMCLFEKGERELKTMISSRPPYCPFSRGDLGYS